MEWHIECSGEKVKVSISPLRNVICDACDKRVSIVHECDNKIMFVG